MVDNTQFQQRLERDLKLADERIKVAQTGIDKARRANIDVAEAQRKLDTSVEDIARIRSVYFPTGAPKE